MKKLLLGFLVLVGLSVKSHAVSMNTEDLNRDFCARYRIAIASTSAITSTSTILVDLSDTINWPHKESGYAVVDGIRLDVDKAAASTSTIKIGVLTYVDSSSGTVTWFYSTENLLNVSNTDNDTISNNGLYPLRCMVYRSTVQNAGTTPYIVSNDKIAIGDSNATVYRSSSTANLMTTTAGTFVAPDLGDIVMDIYKVGNTAITVGIELFYHTERK